MFTTQHVTFSLLHWKDSSPGGSGPTVAHSKHYLSILCPWKLEDLEYDGYCSHLPLIDLTTSSIHFQEAIKLTPEELAEKAEQKGIRNEGKAIRAAERATLKALADQKRARIAAEKQAPAPPSDMEREQLAILRLQALEASESRAPKSPSTISTTPT